MDERQQITAFIQPNGSADQYPQPDQASVAKQLSLLSASSQRTKEYEIFNKQSAMQQQGQPGMQQMPQQSQQNAMQSRQKFLQSVAFISSSRRHFLPQAITGIPSAYDPNNSSLNWIETTPNIGVIRLCGKDVDVTKLWGLVLNTGGSFKVNAANGWGIIAQQLDLPPALDAPHPITGSQATGDLVQRVFAQIFSLFEQAWIQRMRQARMQQMQNAQPGQSPVADTAMGSQQPTVSTPTSAATPIAGDGMPPLAQVHDGTPSAAMGDNDENRKRKSDEPEDRDVKKIKMDGESTMMLSPDRFASEQAQSPVRAQTVEAPGDIKPTPTPQPSKPMRSKIEYTPFKRELETYGGRDIDAIEAELARRAARHRLRPADEYGSIDLEALCLSIRSRVPSEVSWALTTMTLLSCLHGQTVQHGFAMNQSLDLLDDILDLLEETAWGPGFDGLGIGLGDPVSHTRGQEYHTRSWTHRELLEAIGEVNDTLFAGLETDKNRVRGRGPLPSRSDTILIILNLFRNLSVTIDNHDYMGNHPRLLEAILRVVAIAAGKAAPSHGGRTSQPTPVPACDALSLTDLVRARRDALDIVSNLTSGGFLPDRPHFTRALVGLVASFIIDPIEAVPPSTWVRECGLVLNGPSTPPGTREIALDTFARLAHPDINRARIAEAVPLSLLWDLTVAIVHGLPTTEADFQLLFRSNWLGYTERSVLCLYALAFLAPPSLRSRMRSDRSLGIGPVLRRLAARSSAMLEYSDFANIFKGVSRRAAETARVIDTGHGAAGATDSQQATEGAPIAFGMGYGEGAVTSVEKGPGLFGAHAPDIWHAMLQASVVDEQILFSELDSLTRLG